MNEADIAAQGVFKLYELGGVVTVLLLGTLALAWFCRYLIIRNTALSDKFAEVVQQNTQAFVELREAIRDFTRKN